jgi:aspartate/methionine/tyrosine aminotransferase
MLPQFCFRLLLLPATALAAVTGANPVIVDTDADAGFIMSADQLEAALTPQSRLLILCTPSNPTGAFCSGLCKSYTVIGVHK